MTRPVTAVFFAKVDDPAMVEQVSFYFEDLTALRAVCDHVHVVTTYRGLVRRRADMVLCWWWTWALPVILYGRLTGTPVAITGTFNWDPERRLVKSYQTRPRWQRGLIRAAARLADVNLFPSTSEATAVWRGLRLASNRVAHFPHVVTLSPDRTPSTNTPSAPFLFNIAWSGTENLRRKCVFQVVDAFELVASDFDEARLVLAGNPGDGRAALRRRVDASPFRDRIDILGRVTEPAKADLMSKCSAFVSPSIYEGFGVAIAEAALAGAPIITSPVGAVPEILGQAVLYVDGRDPTAIASAMTICLAGEYRKDHISEARQHVGAFTRERKREDLRRVVELLT